MREDLRGKTIRNDLKPTKSLSSYIKEYFVWTALFTLTFIPIISVSASTTRYYAGYYNYGYEEEPDFPLMGVQGDIKTIVHSVPTHSDFYAEWICGILRYYPTTHWVQVGFDRYWVKEWFWWKLTTKFYIEKMDYSGHYISHFGAPIHATIYNYLLSNEEMSDEWSYQIKEGSQVIFSGNLYADKGYADDLQAFVETTTDDIYISDSHFNNLKYLFGYSNWYYWSRHIPLADSPYWLQQVSHYRFYAYGGGS